MNNERIEKTLKLQLFMAKAGVASRRKCEEIIKEKRVMVNGRVVDKLGLRVSLQDTVVVDGEQVSPIKEKCYIAINKPSGYLCSNYDPFGRPLAIELLPEKIRRSFGGLFHVGRLDFSTSGLIFYTNDGLFANIIMHPSFEVEKEYFVKLKNPVVREDLERYKGGLKFENEFYKLKDYRVVGRKSFYVTLNEGKNREIRRVLGHMGYEIFSLIRVRIGIVTLEDIPSGGYRYLNKQEVEWFYRRYRERR